MKAGKQAGRHSRLAVRAELTGSQGDIVWQSCPAGRQG
jgi:hypothetical protein